MKISFLEEDFLGVLSAVHAVVITDSFSCFPLLLQLNAVNSTVHMEAGSVMRGTPICAGKVTARGRVVLSLEDADQLEEVSVLPTRT